MPRTSVLVLLPCSTAHDRRAPTMRHPARWTAIQTWPPPRSRHRWR